MGGAQAAPGGRPASIAGRNRPATTSHARRPTRCPRLLPPPSAAPAASGVLPSTCAIEAVDAVVRYGDKKVSHRGVGRGWGGGGGGWRKGGGETRRHARRPRPAPTRPPLPLNLLPTALAGPGRRHPARPPRHPAHPAWPQRVRQVDPAARTGRPDARFRRRRTLLRAGGLRLPKPRPPGCAAHRGCGRRVWPGPAGPAVQRGRGAGERASRVWRGRVGRRQLSRSPLTGVERPTLARPRCVR